MLMLQRCCSILQQRLLIGPPGLYDITARACVQQEVPIKPAAGTPHSPPAPADCRPPCFPASSAAALPRSTMREIVHIQAGQCGNQIGAKVVPGLGGHLGGHWAGKEPEWVGFHVGI